MARYTYNAGLVTQTIDTLNTACDCLDNTNVDIKKGIDMIYNARGAENMNIDFSPITGYQSSVVEYIEIMINELKNKAQEIEEYQDAPWYKKLFATIGMGALKLVEGLASFVENIGDGLVSIAGFIGGIFSSEFKNSVAEFVRTDYVGETTAKWYEDGWLKSVDKYSYMSHESTAANILKGVGTAAGYVILTVATAGVGGAAAAGSAALTAGTYISAGAAALGGIGSGTQNALKQAQLVNPEMSAGEAFNSAFGQGVKQGAIAAGTTLLTAGIAKGLSNAAGAAKDGANSIGMFKNVVDNADEVAKLSTAGKIANSAKQLVNKGANAVLGSNLGRQVLVKGSNLISKVPAGVVSGITTVAPTIAGVAAGGTFTDIQENAVMEQYQRDIQDPSVAQELYDTTQQAIIDNQPGVATADEAVQNLENLKAQGYEPGSVSQESLGSEATGTETPGVEAEVTGNSTVQNTGTAGNSTTGNTGTSGSSTNGSSGTTHTVTTKPVELPDYPTTGETNTPSPGTQEQQPTYPTTDDVVSGINPVNPGGNSGNAGNIGNSGYTGNTGNGGNTGDSGNAGIDAVTGGTTNLDEVTKEVASSEVLNTFGDVSGSFKELSGTKSNIPTSSSPILSPTDGQKSTSSFVPLGAGLGAASVAGIGAKVYMDKREKSNETENEDIETEEWTENDNVEIDYGLETSEESDYLSPTDELAFTE